MNDQERLETFAQIATFARDAGLGWIVDDVERQIQIGHLRPLSDEPERLSSLLELKEVRLPAGFRNSALVTVRHTPSERLDLLLDAIERTLQQTLDMQDFVVTSLSPDKEPVHVEFRGTDETPSETIRIDGPSPASSLSIVQELSASFNELRRQSRQ